MAVTSVEKVGTGLPGSNILDIPFPYLRPEDVKVTVDGVIRAPNTLTWLSTGQVQLPDSAADLFGKTIRGWRDTPITEAEATFSPGGLDQSDLNGVTIQSLYADQELQNRASDSEANIVALDVRLTTAEPVVARAVLVPEGEPSVVTPPIAERAERLWGWGPDGQPIAVTVDASGINPDAIFMTFTNAGTGATLRTVAAKLRDLPASLDDYGANPQAALDAGRFLFFPPGEHTLMADLQPGDGAVLQAPNAFIRGPYKVLPRGYYTAGVDGNPYPKTPNIWKLKDRVLVGDAADYNGAETRATMLGTGPYSGSTPAITASDLHYLQRDATFHASDPEGMIAILGSAATGRRSGLFR